LRVSFFAHGYLRFTSTLGEDGAILTLTEALAPRIRELLPTFNILEEEVESVSINGKRTRLDHRVHNGDRVDFYPRGYERKAAGRSSVQSLQTKRTEDTG
jgi:putative ubiquitin-RnfH superfamily antitoxin RatB of RatAB toxin-antitoxin module